MALFWPEARLVITLTDAPTPSADERPWPEDVLVLRLRPDQAVDEEFLGRLRRLILSRTHYLSGHGRAPEHVDEPAERALIRLVVRGESPVDLVGERPLPSLEPTGRCGHNSASDLP